MKRILTIALLTIVGFVAYADDLYVLKDQPTHEMIALFEMVDDNPLHWAVEVSLTEETNRLEITKEIMADVTAWYGPSWSGYSSSNSDAEGYCWWTCPEFDETGIVTAEIASGSGLNNHIGIIIPAGNYRISLDSRTGQEPRFMIEKLSKTALSATVQSAKAFKRLVNGQVVIYRAGKAYNLLGSQLD